MEGILEFWVHNLQIGTARCERWPLRIVCVPMHLVHRTSPHDQQWFWKSRFVNFLIVPLQCAYIFTFLLNASKVVEHEQSSMFRDDFQSKATVFNSLSSWLIFNFALLFSSLFPVFSIIASDSGSLANLLSNFSFACTPFFWTLFKFKAELSEPTLCAGKNKIQDLKLSNKSDRTLVPLREA